MSKFSALKPDECKLFNEWLSTVNHSWKNLDDMVAYWQEECEQDKLLNNSKL